MITVEVTFTIKSPILSTFGNRSKDPGAVQSAEWGVQLCTFASQRDPASVKWFISKNDAIIPSKLSCRAGVAQDAQIALVARLPTITLETA